MGGLRGTRQLSGLIVVRVLLRYWGGMYGGRYRAEDSRAKSVLQCHRPMDAVSRSVRQLVLTDGLFAQFGVSPLSHEENYSEESCSTPVSLYRPPIPLPKQFHHNSPSVCFHAVALSGIQRIQQTRKLARLHLKPSAKAATTVPWPCGVRRRARTNMQWTSEPGHQRPNLPSNLPGRSRY